MPTQSESIELLRLVSLKLAAFDIAINPDVLDDDFLKLARPLLRSYENRTRLLPNQLCPVDVRIQAFLDSYLQGSPVGNSSASLPRLPDRSFVLDRTGMARLLSLPAGGNTFSSPY